MVPLHLSSQVYVTLSPLPPLIFFCEGKITIIIYSSRGFLKGIFVALICFSLSLSACQDRRGKRVKGGKRISRIGFSLTELLVHPDDVG